ncbi:MAG: hypothetical protein CSA52_01265 [Gammaproteobacteria bacterium]|nr:MAG: hypothetical protein CSB48_09775 [Pseudomonadota bacterium]PIE38711.1 MAG: hypothetical protein CSA52_01265 [Gammaproteobacteria bacterium]
MTDTQTRPETNPATNTDNSLDSTCHFDSACYETEWAALHASIENCEKLALIFKVAAFILVIVYLLTPMSTLWLFCLLLVLWLQEGIWRTGQSRLENRIQQIEQALSQASDQTPAYHLYSGWQDNRGDTFELVLEYIANAIRPTVAYPYTAVIALVVLAWIL